MIEPRRTALSAHHVSLGYHRGLRLVRDVLEDFSLDLAPREVVAVLGPSGAGKSTLLRVLAGLQAPDAGRVTVFGAEANAPHPAVGIVFQNPCLLPWRTVRRNVALGLDFVTHQISTNGTQAQRVEAALDEVDLGDAADLYPAELSGGMAQRVSLARCLAREPRVLLLDEPFAALDAVTRAAMQSLLRRAVATRGASAVLVTHDIDEALRVADRVVLLRGRPARVAGTWSLPPAASHAALRAVDGALRDTIVRTLAGDDTARTAPVPITRARQVA